MSKYAGHTFTYNKTRFRGKLRERKPNVTNEPKIKFVKQAGQWVLSYFEPDKRGGHTFKQKWSFDKEELINFRTALQNETV